MRGIPIYAPQTEDFSTNGLGLLLPTECTIHRAGNATYELTMTHPITDDLRWAQIQPGCIVKAAAPVRESPLYELETESSETQTVTRKIYKVRTNGSNLHLRQKPSTSSKILSKYKPGTEVVQLKDAGSGWYQVSIVKGGATGYMYAQWLQYVREITETVTTAKPVTQNGVRVQPAREQLFRVYSAAPDTHTGLITVKAMHIGFDLRGNLINEDYKPEKVAAETAIPHAFSKQLNEHDFSLHCGGLSGTVTGEYGYQSFIEALLTPETGMAAQIGALVEFDNYDIFVLPDAVRDMGVTIRRRKNLVGVTVTHDDADVVTRVIPTGRNKDGDPLFLDGQIYIDSPHIGDYPTIRAKRIEYDVSVSDSKDAEFKTDNAARAELRRLVQEDFNSGIDLPTYGMDVKFIFLENTPEYQYYAGLQSVHLFDTVTVIDERIGLKSKVRVTEYEWDVLNEKYTSVTLGDIQSLEQKTYGFTLADGTVSGNKLIQGSVGGEMLRSASIQYAKISVAAIELLTANSLTAVQAHINNIVANNVTTDQLYADLATLAAAQITAANIEKANIDWASIANLNAQIAEISKAHIGDADIDWAKIDNLTAVMANIAQAKIDNLEVRAADIKDLNAVIADILSAEIGSADIDFAQIKDLVTNTAIITEGVGGELYIARLAVTEANMVSLTVGELLLKNENGDFVRLVAGTDGGVKTEVVQVEGDNIANLTINGDQKLIEGSITAKTLNVQDIFADSAIIRQIIAANLDVGTLFARDAFIAQLNTTDIRGNQYLKLTVDGLAEDIADAKAAANAAQQSANTNAADMANIVTTFNADIANLQTQIDGSIMTWFYPTPPTNSNLPASEWTTTDLKNIHLGDLYYDTITGYCYRWQVQNNAYSWQRITDTDVTKALADASKAQDTADSKRRVFYAQPVPPYDQGDLWVQGSGGDILRCQTAKTSAQSYAAADWVLASKYTDDTTADAALAQANANAGKIGELETTVTKHETSITQTADQITLLATKEEVTQAVGAIQIGGRNLIRQGEVMRGYYLNNSGAEEQDSRCMATGFISVSPGGNVILQIWQPETSDEGFARPWTSGIMFYDANQKYLGGYTSDYFSDTYHLVTAAAPQSAAYVRTSFQFPSSAGSGFANQWTSSDENYRFKLEIGTKPTDWTPAPEDIETRVTAAESSITQTADQITLLVERTESIEGSLDTAGSTAETALGMAEILDGKLAETQAAAQTAQNTADDVVRLSQSLQTQITQTAGGLDIVRTQTSDLEGRVETIESGVHIEGATIGIYASGSPFRNVITNSGWTITENDSPVITCAETKLTAPRVQITDAMMIGGLAWKPGNDKHLRLLKYGR